MSYRFWIGIAISLICLWLAARDVPFGDLSNALAGMEYAWLIPAIAGTILTVILRAQRWIVLLGKTDQFGDSFWAQGVGYLFTNVFPLRLGEAARVIVMSERTKLPVLQVAASAAVERMLDVASIVVVLILLLPWMQVPTLVMQAGMSLGGIIVLMPFVLVAMVRFSHVGEGLLESIGRYLTFLPVRALIARWRELVEGFAPLMRWDVVLRSVVLSLVSWAFSVAVYWFVIRAFHAEGTIMEAAFMLVALAFAVTVPSSPGFIGVFQFVGQQALVLPFGAKYNPASALAITVAAYLVYYLVTTGLGVAGLWKLGTSFANLARVVRVGGRGA